MPDTTVEQAPTNTPFIPAKVLPVDTLADAGQKVLLAEFARILQYKTDPATDAANPDVPSLRTAVRRMRGALKLLKTSYKPKTLRRYRHSLNDWSHTLGEIQHLDSLMSDLRAVEAGLNKDQQVTLQAVLEKLALRQAEVRQELGTLTDDKTQRRFQKSLNAAASVAPAVEAAKIAPSRVSHLLPVLIYDRLAALRACGEALTEGDTELPSGLRLQFKRLLDTVSLFEDVLGKQISDFMDEANAIQATLDQIHENATAQARLDSLINTGKKRYTGILEAYRKYRDNKAQSLIAEFKEHWARFNSRKMQQKLAMALATLYEN